MADITTAADLLLKGAAGGAWTIEANKTYSMAAILWIGAGGGFSLTVDESGGAGDVIIDFQDTHVAYSDTNGAAITHNFTGTATSRIIFTRGVSDNFRIYSAGAGSTYNFTYCDFSHSKAGQSGNGICVANAAMGGKVVINMTNCRSYNNDNDGIQIGLLATGYAVWMLLTDCDSYSNGNGANGDGVSSHLPSQRISMTGGSLHDNQKHGASFQGGGIFSCDGTDIYDNGLGVTANGEVYLANASAYINDSHIHITNTASDKAKTQSLIRILGGLCHVTNSLLDCANKTLGTVASCTPSIYVYKGAANEPVDLIMENTVIKNHVAGNYSMQIPALAYVSGTIRFTMKNCTLYKNNAMLLQGSNFNFQNNIIWPNSSVYVNTTSAGYGDYKRNAATGYNCFWGRTTEASYFTAPDGFKTTDVNIDPLFRNTNAGDFTPTNTLLWNAGTEDSGGNNAYVGANQPYDPQNSGGSRYRSRYNGNSAW